MGTTQIVMTLGILVAFAVLGFMMSRSIKQHDHKMKTMKKKKGRTRYMQQERRPGKK